MPDTPTAARLDSDFAAQIIRDQTRLAAEPRQVEPGLYIITDADGSHHTLDLREDIENGQEHPNRKAGRFTLSQVDSFTAYLAKHGLPETEVWADLDRNRITAVINAHEDAHGNAGWGDHRATLQMKVTPDWSDWTSGSGKLSSQVDFAEFVEQHLPNFVSPTGADMLELAQTIKGTSKGNFESTKRLTGGQTAIEWREETTATAGKKGDIKIPDVVDLALQVFEGGPSYRVAARFRYRINAGALSLGYVLERPIEVRRDAFERVVEQITSNTGRDIWHGSADN